MALERQRDVRDKGEERLLVDDEHCKMDFV